MLSELRGARNDLQQAYERIEAKRHTRKLRAAILLATLASLSAVPQLRERLVKLLAQVRPNRPATGSRGSGSDGSSESRPSRLEDLTKEELYARAQASDIPGRSEMSKEQLIEALRKGR